MLSDRLAHLGPLVGARYHRPAYIYVVQCHEFVKVGIAVNVASRFSSLQTACPYELILLGCWRTEKPRQDEGRIHKHWADCHERGEWFRFPKSIMDRITMKPAGSELASILLPSVALAAA